MGSLVTPRLFTILWLLCVFCPHLVYPWFLPERSESGNGGGLFDQDRDQVLVLNYTNLDSYLNSSTAPSVVLFYSSICGHCQRFKQPFSDVAIELQHMRKTVVMTVVNCMDSNRKLCTEKNIDAFPTTRLYPPGKGNKNPKYRTLERLQVLPSKEKIISTLTEAVMGSPNSSDITFQSFREQHAKLKKDSDAMLVLFQKGSGLDSELSNNLRMYSAAFHGVKYARVNLKYPETRESANTFLEQNLKSTGIRKFPLLLHSFYDPYQKKVVNEVIQEASEFPSSFYEAMKVSLAENYRKGPTLDDVFVTGYSKSALESVAEILKDPEVLKVLKTRNNDKVYMEDLLSAAVYTLSSEVPMGLPLPDDAAFEGLRSMLVCIAKFFPDVPSDKTSDLEQLSMSGTIRNTSNALIKFIDSKNINGKRADITHSSWGATLESAFKAFSHNKEASVWEPKFVGCLGSEITYRGYPCSLWTLFHTLQISAYAKNTSDTSVLSAVVLYVTNFFTCAECGENFERETQDFRGFLADGKRAIKYLWQVHNSVNDRLSGDITEDPTHKKVQFPSYRQCPECYFKSPKPDEDPLDISWNEAKVVLYLKKYYSPNNIRFFYPHNVMTSKKSLMKSSNDVQLQTGAAESAKLHGLKSEQERQRDTIGGGFFSRSDIFLLLFIYACSMMCIGVLFCYLQRRKLHKCRAGNGHGKTKYSHA